VKSCLGRKPIGWPIVYYENDPSMIGPPETPTLDSQ
jgi:hypothetical protein